MRLHLNRKSTRRLFVFAAGAALALAACGGKQKGPSHLEYTFQERYLSPIAPERRDQVFDAHRALEVARAELQHAQFLLEDISGQLELVANEVERASLLSVSARVAYQNAARYRQTARMQSADAMMARAAKEQKSRVAQKEYLSTERRYLEAFVEFGQHNVRAAEARLELAKAELAEAEGIGLEGFDIANYRAQLEKRTAHVAKLRTVAQGYRDSADAALAAMEAIVGGPVVSIPVQVERPRALPEVVPSPPLPARRVTTGRPSPAATSARSDPPPAGEASKPSEDDADQQEENEIAPAGDDADEATRAEPAGPDTDR